MCRFFHKTSNDFFFNIFQALFKLDRLHHTSDRPFFTMLRPDHLHPHGSSLGPHSLIPTHFSCVLCDSLIASKSPFTSSFFANHRVLPLVGGNVVVPGGVHNISKKVEK